MIPKIEKIRYYKHETGEYFPVAFLSTGERVRGRSEILILSPDLDRVLICTTKPDVEGAKGFKYAIPGGGWKPHETRKEASIREAMEEVCIATTNVEGPFTAKIEPTRSIKWVEENIPKELQWKNSYDEVYVGIYRNDTDIKNVDPIDRDEKMFKDSKWFLISDIKSKLRKEHAEAIEKYIAMVE